MLESRRLSLVGRISPSPVQRNLIIPRNLLSVLVGVIFAFPEIYAAARSASMGSLFLVFKHENARVLDLWRDALGFVLIGTGAVYVILVRHE